MIMVTLPLYLRRRITLVIMNRQPHVPGVPLVSSHARRVSFARGAALMLRPAHRAAGRATASHGDEDVRDHVRAAAGARGHQYQRPVGGPGAHPTGRRYLINDGREPAIERVGPGAASITSSPDRYATASIARLPDMIMENSARRPERGHCCNDYLR